MPERLGRLRRRAEFLRVAGARRKWAAPGLVLQAAPSADKETMVNGQAEANGGLRVGFTVSRKVGNAVIRNRVRRRLKAVAAEMLPEHAEPGHDYVVIGRAGALNRPYDALCGDLETSLRRLGLWRSGQSSPTARDDEPEPGR